MGPKLQSVALSIVGLLIASPLSAQTVFEDEREVSLSSPEGWAMSYVTSSSLVTGFGGPPELAPGGWAFSAEMGSIPSLSESQQRVGFTGEKAEDLNKSPVFGRARAWVGLPAGWVLEAGYTPELRIDGVRPKNLFAVAAGREIFARGDWRWLGRAYLQRGSARGDITCPADLAGIEDFEINPFGCAAPSSDEIDMDYHGLELTGRWSPHGDGPSYYAGFGYARYELEVQVDAPLFFNSLDRSRLSTDGSILFYSIGVQKRLDANFDLAAELLYVPLDVRREIDGSLENDPYWSLRLQLRWRQ